MPNINWIEGPVRDFRVQVSSNVVNVDCGSLVKDFVLVSTSHEVLASLLNRNPSPMIPRKQRRAFLTVEVSKLFINSI